VSPRRFLSLFKQTFAEWYSDNAQAQAAALAYYTAFSIAPLLIIAVAVAGLLFGAEAARGEIRRQLTELVGDNGATIIEEMMVSARQTGSGAAATAVGLAVLLFGATSVFAQLQDSLNLFWKVKPAASGVKSFLKTRFLSLAMVLGIGFLLLVSLLLSAALSAAGAYLGGLVPGWELTWQIVNAVASFAITTTLFALIYKVLPDAKIAWGDVWLGALVTSVLFVLGKTAIGLYLGKGAIASGYGAAGSLAVVLFWVYYSAQILFLGAEFTRVYSSHHGTLAKQRPPASGPRELRSAPDAVKSGPRTGGANGENHRP
jgi:membrane protein